MAHQVHRQEQGRLGGKQASERATPNTTLGCQHPSPSTAHGPHSTAQHVTHSTEVLSAGEGFKMVLDRKKERKWFFSTHTDIFT